MSKEKTYELWVNKEDHARKLKRHLNPDCQQSVFTILHFKAVS